MKGLTRLVSTGTSGGGEKQAESTSQLQSGHLFNQPRYLRSSLILFDNLFNQLILFTFSDNIYQNRDGCGNWSEGSLGEEDRISPRCGELPPHIPTFIPLNTFTPARLNMRKNLSRSDLPLILEMFGASPTSATPMGEVRYFPREHLYTCISNQTT